MRLSFSCSAFMWNIVNSLNTHEAQQFPGIYLLLHDYMRQTLYLKIQDKCCIILKLKQTLINIIFQDRKCFDILFELCLMFKPSEMNQSQSSKEILFDLHCIILYLWKEYDICCCIQTMFICFKNNHFNIDWKLISTTRTDSFL